MAKRLQLATAYGTLLFLVCASQSALGGVITYTYQGLPLLLDPVYEDYCSTSGDPLCLPELPGLTGFMSIDEFALPGGSLANATIELISGPFGSLASTAVNQPAGSFFASAACPVPAEFDLSCFFPPPGVIRYEIDQAFGAALRPTGEAMTQLVFDADKNIIEWDILILDGPPDYGINMSGDFYVTGVVDWSSPAPGTWTRVSEPSTTALMSVGLGLLALALSTRRLPGRFRKSTEMTRASGQSQPHAMPRMSVRMVS